MCVLARQVLPHPSVSFGTRGAFSVCHPTEDILDASCFRLPHSDGRFWGRWPALRQYEHVPFTLSELLRPARLGLCCPDRLRPEQPYSLCLHCAVQVQGGIEAASVLVMCHI